MFIRFPRGNDETNQQVTAPQGSLLVDLETKALHFHDGESPGGYRAVGEKVYLGPLLPMSDFTLSLVGYEPLEPLYKLSGFALSLQGLVAEAPLYRLRDFRLEPVGYVD